MSDKKSIRLTLVKSLNGRLPRHKATAAGLGLTRMHQTVTVQDTPEIRGMIAKVSYLLDVKEG